MTNRPKPLSTRIKKKNMISALKASFGVITVASDAAGVDRTTHYKWMKSDKEYARQVLELEEKKKDFVEHKLIALINNGNPQATIYAAEALLKDRGYVKRQEVTGKGGAPVGHGAITHVVTFKNSKEGETSDEEAETDE